MWRSPVSTEDEGSLQAGESSQLSTQRKTSAHDQNKKTELHCPQWTDLLSELHGLQGQLSGGSHDDGPGPRFGLRSLKSLKHGHQEGSRLTAARPRHGNNVFAIQDHRDGLRDNTDNISVLKDVWEQTPRVALVHLSLDWSGNFVTFLHDSFVNRETET